MLHSARQPQGEPLSQIRFQALLARLGVEEDVSATGRSGRAPAPGQRGHRKNAGRCSRGGDEDTVALAARTEIMLKRKGMR